MTSYVRLMIVEIKHFKSKFRPRTTLKKMCKVQDFLIFGWIHTELILLYLPYAEHVLTLLQYQLCLIWCGD